MAFGNTQIPLEIVSSIMNTPTQELVVQVEGEINVDDYLVERLVEGVNVDILSPTDDVQVVDVEEQEYEVVYNIQVVNMAHTLQIYGLPQTYEYGINHINCSSIFMSCNFF